MISLQIWNQLSYYSNFHFPVTNATFLLQNLRINTLFCYFALRRNNNSAKYPFSGFISYIFRIMYIWGLLRIHFSRAKLNGDLRRFFLGRHFFLLFFTRKFITKLIDLQFFIFSFILHLICSSGLLSNKVRCLEKNYSNLKIESFDFSLFFQKKVNIL